MTRPAGATPWATVRDGADAEMASARLAASATRAGMTSLLEKCPGSAVTGRKEVREKPTSFDDYQVDSVLPADGRRPARLALRYARPKMSATLVTGLQRLGRYREVRVRSNARAHLRANPIRALAGGERYH